MIRRLLSSITCLAVLLVVMTAYQLLIAPQIDPPAHSPTSLMGSEEWNVTPSPNQLALQRLFPPDAWQLHAPRTIESDYAILVFQQYEQRENELELTPCSIVFFAGDGPSQSKRPFILKSPEGAVIQSDGILQLGQSSGGRFSSGRLIGNVSIHSPETAPGKGDSIRINTRNVQIDRQRIWTTHDVDFQLGPHQGRGRDLVINLMDIDDDSGADPGQRANGQLDSLELIHVDQLRLQATANPLDLDAKAQATAASDPSMIPIDVACDGPFRFEFQQLQLSLEDNVELTIRQPGKEPDRLSCQRLKLSFFRPGPASNPTSSSDPTPTVSVVSSLTPQSLVASGNPAILQSPSSQAMVRTERLSYDFHQRNLVISDPREALIVYQDSRVVAPSIAYQLPAQDDQLGQLHAEGNGRFERSLPGGGTLIASWRDNCHLQRHQQEHVLSINGAATVSTSRQQTVKSDELHVWLESTPTADAETPSSANNPARPGKRASIRPTKMAAIGNVRLETPQLRGRTARAEIWIRHFSKADVAATSALPSSSDDLAGLAASANEEDRPVSSSFEVEGDLVRAQLLDYGDQPVISDMTIQGNVQVTQRKGTLANGTPALALEGTALQMQRDTRGLAAIQVQGNPDDNRLAKVTLEQMQLSGPAIQLDQAANRLWVEGPGQLVTTPAREEGTMRGQQHIRWEKRLDFDGSIARLEGNVLTRGQQPLAGNRTAEVIVRSGEMRFHLSRRLDFANPRSADTVELQQLVFDQGVQLDNETRDSKGERISLDSFTLEQLAIEPSTGQLKGSGAGQINSVFQHKDKDAAAVETVSLANLFVQFGDGLDGNFQKRIVSFRGQVHGVYGVVDRWDASLARPRRQGPLPEDVEIDCQQLTVADLALAGRRGVELEAVGNTSLRSQQHVARAHRLTYSQAKEILVLEGGREPARLWLGENRTTTPNAVARRIRYERLSGRVEINGASNINLDRLPTANPR